MTMTKHEAQLAVYNGTGLQVQQQDIMQTRAVSRLAEWASAASAAFQVAEGIVQTSFVPAQFKGKPQEATAAILSGAEVGLSPMASLKSFDIIQGTAAPRALTLRAIVQSQGHEMVVEESTATRCKMKGRRRNSDQWIQVIWTKDRADSLGLSTKDNWRKQPQAMLVARATAELARLIAADAILGIGYTVEEVQDGAVGAEGTSEAGTDEPTASGGRTMQRPPKDKKDEPAPAKKAAKAPAKKVATKKAAASTPVETPVDDGQLPNPPVEPIEGQLAVDAELVVEDPPEDAKVGGPGMSDEQRRKMFAQFDDLGIKDRAKYRAYIEAVVGHPVQSSNELTVDEATQVIESQIADLEAKGK